MSFKARYFSECLFANCACVWLLSGVDGMCLHDSRNSSLETVQFREGPSVKKLKTRTSSLRKRLVVQVG